ncbi:MAG: DUF1778 domain-containing protein [Pirellulaceae bacterium]
MLDEKKTARLEARLPVAVHSLLKEAADLQGRSLSDFVVASAREAAERTLALRSEIKLSLSEQKRFAAALLKPPPTAPALRKAMKDRERLLDPS